MVKQFLRDQKKDSASYALGEFDTAGGYQNIHDDSLFIEDPELLAAEQKDSRLKSFIHTLSRVSVGDSYNLLAFQAGSFGLRGALIRNADQAAILGPVAESRNVDFTRAIAEVLEQLKLHAKRLPKTAILTTPSVIASIVELPVSPLRPRSDDEMQELIRWELEGALSQQNKHWLIGSILVERGYLTASERDDLVAELKIRQSQGGQEGLLRFGDLAVQLKYITCEQLEECFVLQGKLIAVDDDLAYGWQAEEPQISEGLSDEILLSALEDQDSSHKWLVSGMSKAVRRRWVGAFNLNGLKLEAFYPAVGSSFAAITQHCKGEQQALIEVHQEQLAFICGSLKAVNEIRVEGRLSGDIRRAEIEKLIGVLPSDLKQLYINFQGAQQEDLLFILEQYTNMTIEPLSLDASGIHFPENLPIDALIGLTGAANHYLGNVPKARLSWVPVRDFEPAVWKILLSPKVLKTTTALFVFSLMVGFIGWMQWNMSQQQERLDALNFRFEKESKLKQQFAEIESAQNQLKQKIAEAESEVALNTDLLAMIGTEIPRDKNLINILQKSLVLVTPDGVSLQMITQTDGLITIAAYAVSDTQGQQFVSALNKVMLPLDYQVFSSDVTEVEESTQLPFRSYQVNITLSQQVAAFTKGIM